MKFAGCLMLLSGWMIVLVALVLLPGLGARTGFAAAGFVVEIVGLALIARGQINEQREAQSVAHSIDATRPIQTSFGSYR